MSTALTFQSTTFDVIDRNCQPWIKASQLAQALGYAREDKVARLYNRHADEFTPSMTQVIEITDTPTLGRELVTRVRIFSLRGCHLITMFARTEIAKSFRVWVLDVLESLNRPKALQNSQQLASAPITPDQQRTLQDMVKGIVDKGGVYANIWSRFNNHFRLGGYKQLPQSRMSEAVAYLMALQPKPKALPKQKALPAARTEHSEVDALLSKIRFYVKEIADAEKQITELTDQDMVQAFMPHPGREHPAWKFTINVGCTTQSLFSSINFTLRAIEESVSMRLERL